MSAIATASTQLPLGELDLQAGREAAERLDREWPDVSWVPPWPSEAWAEGAIGRLAELIREQSPLFRASREGSEQGAESLSPRPFHGLFEVLQNADDLGASELRIAVRQRGRGRDLLIVHDGGRVQLGHVGAMVLPWVTTKAGDPNASGRFGIGQKTLRSLGNPIEVHCSPFHFRMDPDGPTACEPSPALEGLYAPDRHETLLLIPLLPSIDTDALIAFIESMESRSLLFLRSVRRLSVVELASGERKVDHALVEDGSSSVHLQIAGKNLVGERLELRDPKLRQSYIRYVVERPLSKSDQRYHKATGQTTTLGFALRTSMGELAGGLYDRLPLPVRFGFPFDLNAQFDPDTARTTLLERPWNENRLQDLGELVVAAALDCFARDAATGWWAVPLQSELPQSASQWLGERIRFAIVESVQRRLAEELKLKAQGKPRHLGELVYEEAALDGLLTREDAETLSPGRFAISAESRDAGGRWRHILQDLGRSQVLETKEALGVFDQEDSQLGERETSWYVSMARAAVDCDVLNDFLYKRSILLADHRRIEPPGPNDPRSLVCGVQDNGLAGTLGVALAIHPAYLANKEDARRVVAALKDAGSLVAECDSADRVLQILARDHTQNTIGRLRVDDAQLLSLRSAFERLDEEKQREMGPRVGQNIEIRGFTFGEEGRREEMWTAPGEAYLPTAVDHDRDSFARAAAKTPGLQWVHESYSQLLRRAGGRSQIGAQRLLTRLGAATSPRLVRPSNDEVLSRDRRTASAVSSIQRPDLQLREIGTLSPRRTHLLEDHWSPDLDAVIADICGDHNAKRRRHRGLTLLGVFARSWERHYAERQHAQATYAYYGSWQDAHEVIATWVARAASQPWLPAASGKMHAPTDLLLPTEANRLMYSETRSLFLAKVEDQVLRSEAVLALRLRPGPSASSVISRLQELRDKPLTEEVEREARTAYRLLALSCPQDGRGKLIDDVTVAALRTAFAGTGRRGLLLLDRRWRSPEDVLAGPPIFGHHRVFAPNVPSLEPLWRTLDIREPDAADCVAVIRELAAVPLVPDDRATMLQTLRTLGTRLKSMSPQSRGRLRLLPLWTGSGWLSTRPIYALDDEGLAAQAATQVPVWDHGFSSLTGFEPLLAALEVTPLRPSNFVPVSLGKRGTVAGTELRGRFAIAVEHLRDELARGDEPLHDSLKVGWQKLCLAHVIVDDRLEIAATLPSAKRIVISADAHLVIEPLTFVVRTADKAGSAEAGGRAIASAFSGDRQKVAWAWASMWQRAGEGVMPERIILPAGADHKTDDESDGLIRLKGQVADRGARKPAKRNSAGPRPAADTIKIRELKDLSRLEPDDGVIVNPGESRTGVLLPIQSPDGRVRRGSISALRSTSLAIRTSASSRSVLPPLSDREQLAIDAVQAALRLDPPEIVDLRSRHGIGADAMDELRHFYEIKMSSGDPPNEATITPQEVEAASDPDFFLAVVSGLEDTDAELRVRFIFKPLARLTVRIKGDVTLTGIQEVEALEYRFRKLEQD